MSESDEDAPDLMTQAAAIREELHHRGDTDAADLIAALVGVIEEQDQRIDSMIEEGVEAGLGFKSMTAEDGTLNLSVVTEGAAEATMLAILDGMANLLDENEADNYVEFELIRRGKRPVSACVRWLHNPTPHQLRVQAEAARDRALEDLERATDTLNQLREIAPALRRAENIRDWYQAGTRVLRALGMEER